VEGEEEGQEGGEEEGVAEGLTRSSPPGCLPSLFGKEGYQGLRAFVTALGHPSTAWK
jgi:hypothetical protein